MSETKIEQDGKRYLLRNPPPPAASTVFKTLGIALPPLVRRTARWRVHRPIPTHHRQPVVAGHAVVPRAREFPELPRQINKLTILDQLDIACVRFAPRQVDLRFDLPA